MMTLIINCLMTALPKECVISFDGLYSCIHYLAISRLYKSEQDLPTLC